jgi:hypothetical protein
MVKIRVMALGDMMAPVSAVREIGNQRSEAAKRGLVKN